MNFNKNENIRKSGEIIGFILMYVIFTIMFYLILKFSNKIPDNWNFFYMSLITFLITAIGILLRKFLEK
ncbi:MAG: hypothetical protein AABX54_05910 [Nanoarchaeota archaeon]